MRRQKVERLPSLTSNRRRPLFARAARMNGQAGVFIPLLSITDVNTIESWFSEVNETEPEQQKLAA